MECMVHYLLALFKVFNIRIQVTEVQYRTEFIQHSYFLTLFKALTVVTNVIGKKHLTGFHRDKRRLHI